MSKWVTNLLREHPALLVSILYLVASTIGMFYSWSYLRHFGINVFLYAQIGDFLLASLKEPFTWVLVVIAIAVVGLDNSSSRWVGRKTTARWIRWYGSARYRQLNFLSAIAIILAWLHLYALTQAGDTREGHGQIVEVTLSDASTAKPALLLGTTGQFLFLYDTATGQVDIHPHESVATISFRAPGRE